MVGDTEISRRALLLGGAGLALPNQVSARIPTRVVCLEWQAAELVLSLGVVPVAIGDVRGYRDWVVEPLLPEIVQDLGTRFEPNLELLRLLVPDLVIATRGYGSGGEQAARYAPTLDVSPYSPDLPPLDHATAELRRVAVALGRDAEPVVGRLNAAIAAARGRVGGLAEPVAVLSLFEGRIARIYGGGGLIGAALDSVGLRNAWVDPVNRWGFASVGIDRLARLDPATRVVVIDPVPAATRVLLNDSTLWANLPFVRSGRITHIPPVWSFGGPVAAARFAKAIANGLDSRRST